MNIKVNPIIDMDIEDVATIRKAKRICDELIEVLAMHTETDYAYIACADNGETLVTEKELFTMFDALKNMDKIFTEAPSACDGSGHKELAVKFLG